MKYVKQLFIILVLLLMTNVYPAYANSKSFKLYLEAGNKYMIQNNFNNALSCYRSAVKEKP